ncbi:MULTISPECIES: hypothetical protein [unclassified Streptomyces]|uniref:hypothetical protein n=1 Tax=unclassified Streptomyces TaxID=2593676 RepID=UPI0008EE90F7|nr:MULTISPECIES: hypothetical protein [unclassified Streptomyces]SFN05270.1 hypothetical protein SAMN04487980_101091 [Streptomyces sp. cf124]
MRYGRRSAGLAGGTAAGPRRLLGRHVHGTDDSAWTAVNTPHTWNAADGADGHHRGTGWYRGHCTVPSDLAGKRLYQVMSTEPGTTAALGESVHGHPVDVLVRTQDAARPQAVLLDRGPDEGADEARHIRLMLHRRRLVDNGEESGHALRYPA